jgi:GTPase SAR1 family protein
MEEDLGESAFASYSVPLKIRTKVCLVGEQGTGKSAMASVFASGAQAFPKEYKATYGVEIPAVKDMKMPDNSGEVEMFLVDCSGCPAGSEYLNPHFEDAGCFIFVYDCMRPETLGNLPKWFGRVSTALQAARGDAASILGCVVAAKADLKDRMDMPSIMQGQQFAQEHGLEFFEISAQQGQVDDPFNFLSQVYMQKYEERRLQLHELIGY